MKAEPTEDWILGQNNRWLVLVRGGDVTFSSRRSAEEYVRFKKAQNKNPVFYDMSAAILKRKENEPHSSDYLIAHYVKKILQLT